MGKNLKTTHGYSEEQTKILHKDMLSFIFYHGNVNQNHSETHFT